MSQRTKTELLQHWRPRYRRSGRPRKQHILDEFCALTGSSRKHAIKLLNGQAGRRQNPPGRKLIYTPEVVEPLKQIWLCCAPTSSARSCCTRPYQTGSGSTNNVLDD